MRLLAFDFGLKKIGVAFGQSITQSAQPLNVLKYKADQSLWQLIGPIIDHWHPDHLLVGNPINMDDSDSAMSQAAQEFARYLEKRSQLPVFMIDERLTSREARWRLQTSDPKRNRKAAIDAIAAQLLIEAWFQQKIQPK